MESFVEEFLRYCHSDKCDDIQMIDSNFSRLIPGGNSIWTLVQNLDYALLLNGFPFTVGIADEEPCISIIAHHVMAATLESSAIMATTAESSAIMPAIPGSESSSQVSSPCSFVAVTMASPASSCLLRLSHGSRPRVACSPRHCHKDRSRAARSPRHSYRGHLQDAHS